MLDFFIDTIIIVSIGKLLVWAMSFYPDIFHDRFSKNSLTYIGIFVYASYYILFEGNNGQTIGKMLTNTKVVDENGTRAHWGHALVRTICRFVPIYDPLSFLWGVGFHDSYSKTIVISNKSMDVGGTNYTLKSILNAIGILMSVLAADVLFSAMVAYS